MTSYVTANVAKHMFCKETGLAAYLLIKLVAKTSSSSSCNCDCGLGRLMHSSFILVITGTTFLLFCISHIDNTHIADSGAPNTHLPRNSFLILFICVQIASFWHSFATLFSVSPIPFSPLGHIAADVLYCCNFIYYILEVKISSP